MIQIRTKRERQLYKLKSSGIVRHVRHVRRALRYQRVEKRSSRVDWKKQKLKSVGQLVFWAQSTTADYIRARQTFLKRLQLKGPVRRKQDGKNRARKQRIVGRIYGMKHSWKGHKDRNKNRIKRVGKLGCFMSRTQTLTSPPREAEPAGTPKNKNPC